MQDEFATVREEIGDFRTAMDKRFAALEEKLDTLIEQERS